MKAWLPLLIAPATLAVSWMLTGAARRYALRTRMLDVPGERSSHLVPVPRGGGIAISACVFTAAAALHFSGLLAAHVAWAFAACGGAVSAIGWLDDRRNLSPWWRAVAYLGIAIVALRLFGGTECVRFAAALQCYGVPLQLLLVVGLVWMTNLYNFMDGSDGLAAGEGVCVAGTGALLLWQGGAPGMSLLLLVTAAACAGFLVWNWNPARIHMGDSGSCFLGFVFGLAMIEGTVPLLVWFILLAPFICDATLTLLRRMAAGERWYIAHHTHCYQLLLEAGSTHRNVAMALVLINLFILGPAAWYAASHPGAIVPLAGIVLLACTAGWAAVQIKLYRKLRPKP